MVAPAAAAAAGAVKNIPPMGWIVGGVLVAGAGFLWYRTVSGLFGRVADLPGDLVDGAVGLGKKTVDVFEDAGSAALDIGEDAVAAAADEVEDLSRFLGKVGAKAESKVSTAVDNAISDVKTSALAVRANQVQRNARRGASKATKKVASGVKSTKKKIKGALGRLF